MNWKAVTEELPDDDTTVLMATTTSEPVWPGFRDGDRWRDMSGWPLPDGTVTHWMHFPDPPEVGK